MQMIWLLLIFTANLRPTQACDADCQICVGYRNDECVACGAHAHLAGNLPDRCECNSGYSRRPDSMHCCHPDCDTCNGPNDDDCTSCGPNATLSSGHCICNADHFCKNPDAMHCICHPDCKTCNGCDSDDCLNCYLNASIHSMDQCDCIPTYCPTPDAGHCTATCNGNCSTCVAGSCDQSKCTQCGANAVYGGGTMNKCSCAAGFFANTDAMHCSNACNSACFTCSGPAATQCLTCSANAALSANKTCTCVRGFYPNPSATTCAQCQTLCTACTTLAVCYVCVSGASLSAGVCSCPSAYYADSVSNSCKRCNNSCLTCNGSGPTACLTCFAGFNLAVNTCTCAVSCASCSSTCQTCTGNQLDCLSCFAGAYLVGGNRCQCSSGYYPSNDASNCQLCDVTCAACTAAGGNNCSLCFSDAALDSANACVCLPTFYPSPDSSSCATCDPACNTCFDGDPNDCLSCPVNSSLSTSTCFCDSGFFGSPPLCTLCNSSCLTCSGLADSQCLSCKAYASLVGSTCVCDPNTYPNPNAGLCALCDNLCLTCQGPNQCLTCAANASLSSGSLSPCICLAGFYVASGLCAACPSTCQTCSSASVCLTCKPNSLLQVSDCVCPPSFYGYPDASNCLPCATGCQLCAAAGCIKCATGWLKLNTECVVSCPAGYIATATDCELGDSTPPEPSMVVNLNNSLSVSFSKEMVMNMTATSLGVEVVDVDQVTYSVTWGEPVVQSKLEFRLDLKIGERSLPPQNQATLTFLQPNSVVDTLGIHIVKYQLTGVLHEFGQTAPTTALNSTIRTTAAAMSQGSVGATTTVSILNGNPTALWSLLNQLQLITYIPMTTIPIGTKFAGTLIALNIAGFVPNPFQYIISTNETGQSPPQFAVNYGVDTTLFLGNVGLMISTAVTLLLSMIPIYLLSRVSVGFVADYFRKMLPSFRWGIFLRWWIQSYLDIGIYALLELYQTHTADSLHTSIIDFNFVLSVLFACLFATTPIALSLFTWLNYHKMTHRVDAVFNKRWGTLYEELVDNKELTTVLYYHTFLIRRCIYAFTIICLSDKPGAQALISTSTAFAIALYVFAYKPFADRMDQLTAVVLELSTAIIFLIASLFLLDLSLSGIDAVEFIGVWTVLGAIVINGLLSIVRTILMVVDLFNEYKKHAKKVGVKFGSKRQITPSFTNDLSNEFLFVAPCHKPPSMVVS